MPTLSISTLTSIVVLAATMPLPPAPAPLPSPAPLLLLLAYPIPAFAAFNPLASLLLGFALCSTTEFCISLQCS